MCAIDRAGKRGGATTGISSEVRAKRNGIIKVDIPAAGGEGEGVVEQNSARGIHGDVAATGGNATGGIGQYLVACGKRDVFAGGQREGSVLQVEVDVISGLQNDVRRLRQAG